MRAAVYDPQTGMVLQEIPDPILNPGEALIAVEACGVCGSDKQVVAGESAPVGTRFPIVLGHEIAGRILALDPAMAGEWQVGDEVVVFPFVPCGECRQCTRGAENLCARQELVGYHHPGGYAEVTAVPMQILLPRPKGVSAPAAALLVDAFATPFHALAQVGRVGPADRVIILGTGGTGLAGIQLARALNVLAVGAVTRRESAAQEAEAAGAEAVWVRSEDDRRIAREIRRWSEGGADIVLDTVGTGESAEFAMDLLRPGGRLCLIGMGDGEARLPIAKSVRRGITVAASFGSTMEDVRALIQMTEAGQLHPGQLIAKTLPLESIAEAFRTSPTSGRTVIQPTMVR